MESEKRYNSNGKEQAWNKLLEKYEKLERSGEELSFREFMHRMLFGRSAVNQKLAREAIYGAARDSVRTQ